MLKLPVVFYHGKSFNLVTFGLFAALSSIVGYSIAYFFLFSRGLPVTEYSWFMVFFIIVPNLVCAKLFSVFSTGRKRFLKNLRYHLNETSFYQQGGIFGFIIGLICLFYIRRIPFFLLCDAVGLGAFATMFIGRLGCYNYGCCVGKPAQGNFGITYSDPEAKICREVPGFKGILLIPVQLIASSIDLFLFCLSVGVVHFYPFSGVILIIFLLGINLKRIILQPLRWKDSSNKISYQWVAFILIITLLLMILFFYVSGEVIFREETAMIPFTPIMFVKFIMTNPEIFFPLFAGAVINFIAYGIHGKKPGTHFNITS